DGPSPPGRGGARLRDPLPAGYHPVDRGAVAGGAGAPVRPARARIPEAAVLTASPIVPAPGGHVVAEAAVRRVEDQAQQHQRDARSPDRGWLVQSAGAVTGGGRVR